MSVFCLFLCSLVWCVGGVVRFVVFVVVGVYVRVGGALLVGVRVCLYVCVCVSPTGCQWADLRQAFSALHGQ